MEDIGTNDNTLELAIAALSSDYSKLGSRIRSSSKSINCDCDGIRIRLNYPSFRQGIATIAELVDAIFHYLPSFCLPRSQIDELKALYQSIDVSEFMMRLSTLTEEAKDIFCRAQRATNRNGEAGELLLYLLTEWILDAPQLIAKMSLKTNPNMPVHGADGVHVRYDADGAKLLLYWGEAKLYADVGQAIKNAAESVAESLKPEKMKHELNLVKRNIAFAGLDGAGKESLLKYLDPFDESYNKRHDIITCLISFDFDGFKSITKNDGDSAENKFEALASKKLAEVSPVISAAAAAEGIDNAIVEMFFFPVPSVQDLRDRFQDKIGWSSA